MAEEADPNLEKEGGYEDFLEGKECSTFYLVINFTFLTTIQTFSDTIFAQRAKQNM